MVRVASTPRDTVFTDGASQLYHFRRSDAGPAEGMPLLLVPSLINRWYVLDMRPGASLVSTLVDAPFDTYCLDWGAPRDEDRYLTWDDLVRRLGRMVRRVKRLTGAPRVGVLGYCMGATLSGIYSALHPEDVAVFVNLAGPFDFRQGGALARMTDPDWFDADAIADGGNVHPLQMQSGFISLRPTGQIGKWVALASRFQDPEYREAFLALETWANDNVAFPAEAYRTYIRELYQGNALVAGAHRVEGREVHLETITCPVLTVAAERDTICPLPAAAALHERVGSQDRELMIVPGGHIGAVVGSRAPTLLYPRVAGWLRKRLCSSTN